MLPHFLDHRFDYFTDIPNDLKSYYKEFERHAVEGDY